MWKDQAPSNIAVIKYMGKKEGGINSPVNPSLSWTLDHLNTQVELSVSGDSQDSWYPLETPFPVELSRGAQERFLSHLGYLKDQFSIKECFRVGSGNNFPSDCGIASSASSFAALTRAALVAFGSIRKNFQPFSPVEQARWSAVGSGSSCRSFFSGWVYWDGEKVENIKLGFEDLVHMVVVVSSKIKKIPSSKAHERVPTSSLFKGRGQRVQDRLERTIQSHKDLDWSSLFQICWEEFWDMHSLFLTSRPCFNYLLPESLEVINSIWSLWELRGLGPLLTMDAGPNVHLLWRSKDKELALEYYRDFLEKQYTVLSDIEEVGFAKV